MGHPDGVSPQEPSALDADRMDLALAQAEAAVGLSDPNPRVGCVLGRADGTVIGLGFTQRAGGPHAEVMALRDAQAAGHDPRGATAWVTLEPCSHHGRTPPCCDALIDAGVARVVIALRDPNPAVDGQGIDRLLAAGIEVVMAGESFAERSRTLNIGFVSRHQRGRPWVRMKIACSLDGRTATPSGSSRWITGADSRRDGHAWRRRAGAVVTGIGTVLADDPRLDVREVPTMLQPLRVVVDTRARLPAAAAITRPPGRLLLITAAAEQARHLASDTVEVVALPRDPGGIDLNALIAELHRREVNEVHVEAGSRLSGRFLQFDLVDELLVYLAPKLIGPGRPLADLPELASIDNATTWTLADLCRTGPDCRLLLRRDA